MYRHPVAADHDLRDLVEQTKQFRREVHPAAVRGLQDNGFVLALREMEKSVERGSGLAGRHARGDDNSPRVNGRSTHGSSISGKRNKCNRVRLLRLLIGGDPVPVLTLAARTGYR